MSNIDTVWEAFMQKVAAVPLAQVPAKEKQEKLRQSFAPSNKQRRMATATYKKESKVPELKQSEKRKTKLNILKDTTK